MPEGRCIECPNGDWYCPGENGDAGTEDCPAGSGFAEWRKAGEAWYDQEGKFHWGYYVWVRATCKGNEPIVDVWLQKVFKEVDPADRTKSEVYVRERMVLPMGIQILRHRFPDLELPDLED